MQVNKIFPYSHFLREEKKKRWLQELTLSIVIYGIGIPMLVFKVIKDAIR